MIKADYLVKADLNKVLRCVDKFGKQISKMNPCTYSLVNTENGIVVNISFHDRRKLGELQRRFKHIKNASFHLIKVKGGFDA